MGSANRCNPRAASERRNAPFVSMSIPECECRRKSRLRTESRLRASTRLREADWRVAQPRPRARSSTNSWRGRVTSLWRGTQERRGVHLQLCGYTVKALFGQLKRLIRHSAYYFYFFSNGNLILGCLNIYCNWRVRFYNSPQDARCKILS